MIIAGVAAATQVGAATSSTDHPALPPGPGRDTLLRVCSACHDPDIVAHQSLDAQGWKDTVNTMADRGATATDAELGQITDYLIKSFSPQPPPDPAPLGGQKK
jgi:competence protein ComEA